MKKHLLLSAGLIIAAMTACQKEIDQNVNLNATDSVTFRFEVNDNEWDGVRSSYIEGTGVKLAGNENIAVFYDNSVSKGGSTEGFTKAIVGVSATDPIKATGTGFSYSFTAPEEAASATAWYAIMPYASTLVKATTDETPTATVQIHSVQYPTATSFDPHYDFLAAEPFCFTPSGSAYSGTINAFKRLSAPFRIVLSGLDAADKVYAATITLSTAASGTDGLTGIFRVALSDNADETGITGSTAIGNGVTALYPEGLAAVGGKWNVWYCVNATSLKGGDKLTLSVTTATKTYTREITLPSDAAIEPTSLKQLSLNVKGAGFTEESSILQDFGEMKTSTSVVLTASDGIERTYSFASGSCIIDPSDDSKAQYYDGGAGTPKGIMVSVPTGTNKWMQIPSIGGKKITKIGLYVHNASGKGTAGIYNTNEKAARDAIISADATNSSLYPTGGYVELSLPEGCDDFTGKYFQSTGTQEFVAAKFFFEDEPEEEITDYYAAFDAGKTLTIAGKEYNKTSNSNYGLVNVEDLTTASFSTSGKIYFIDNSNTASIELSGSITFGENAVVIGRFRASQPKILHSGNYLSATNAVTLKNIYIENSYSNGMFNTSKSSPYCNLTIEDCTLKYTGTNALFKEGSNDKYFGDVLVLNSVLQFNQSMIGCASSAGTTSLGKEKSISLRNCVITPATVDTPVAKSLMDFKTNVTTPDGDSTKEQTVKIFLENNTIYNFKLVSSGGIICSWTIGGLKVEKNVIYTSAFATDSNNTRVIKTNVNQTFSPDPASISYNWCYSDGTVKIGPTNGNSPKYWNSADHNTALPTYVNVDNLFSLENTTIPFAGGYDASKGYLPIDPAVVTNGAGADVSKMPWLK